MDKIKIKEVTEELMTTIGNLTRIGFILYLGDNPNSCFSDLRRKTSSNPCNPGSVKYHIDILMKKNIVKKAYQRYSLTELGNSAYQLLGYLIKNISC